MSYCRFSDMNFACDAYVYESCNGGYVVCVASNRIVTELPPRPMIDTGEMTDDEQYEWAKEFAVEYNTWLDAVTAAERVPINGPLDGEYRNFNTPGETADFLEEMRSEGYNVPQYAIDALRDEAG